MSAFPKELFAKETPYKAPEYHGETYAPAEVEVVEEPVEETLTIPPAPVSIDALFAKQDALRTRFTNLKKYIVKEIPKSDEKVTALLMLDDTLVALVKGLTKEMK